MKRNIRLILVGALAAVLLAGCGEQATEEPAEEAPAIVHIYSTNEDIANDLEYVWQKHTDWKERVEFVTLPEEGYVEAIEALLQNKEEEKCPDIILADYNDVPYFTSTEDMLTVAELGLTEADLNQMYAYTTEYASDAEGNVKGLSWRVQPGAFVYRKSLALNFLGYDDEENVQSFVRDWDTFVDTARTVDKKSDGNVKMLVSVSDIEKTFAGAAWMKGEEAVIDSRYSKMLDIEYALKNNNFALGLARDSEQYIKVANKGNIFGYFCSLDMLKALNQECTGELKGDWAVCRGPKAYVCGGDWIFVTKNCSDSELAGNILKELCCDANILKQIRENNDEFVNNIKEMSNAYNLGKGKIELLGGGDYIKTYSDAAGKATIADRSIHDGKLEAMYLSLAGSYCEGKSSKEEIEDSYRQEALELLQPALIEEDETGTDTEAEQD